MHWLSRTPWFPGVSVQTFTKTHVFLGFSALLFKHPTCFWALNAIRSHPHTCTEKRIRPKDIQIQKEYGKSTEVSLEAPRRITVAQKRMWKSAQRITDTEINCRSWPEKLQIQKLMPNNPPQWITDTKHNSKESTQRITDAEIKKEQNSVSAFLN